MRDSVENQLAAIANVIAMTVDELNSKGYCETDLNSFDEYDVDDIIQHFASLTVDSLEKHLSPIKESMGKLDAKKILQPSNSFRESLHHERCVSVSSITSLVTKIQPAHP